MKRKNRLYAVIALCLVLVLAVAALVTIGTAPDIAQTRSLQTETPEATSSGASASAPSDAPSPSPEGTTPPERTPTPVPTAQPEPTAKPAAAPTAAPTPAPTPDPAPNAETVKLSIRCPLALASAELDDAIRAVLPEGGVILAETEIELEAGESVWNLLQRVCRENGVALEADWTPAYNTAYVRGIGHLYEFDCGRGSGWIYRVNGAVPNVGCSSCTLQPGDTVEWLYTCDFGNDL